MPYEAKLLSVTLFREFQEVSSRGRVFADTDPQMLHAILRMETGADPDVSLEEVERAEVVYDKFRPRVVSTR